MDQAKGRLKKKKEGINGGVQCKILLKIMLENDGRCHGSFSLQHPVHECYVTSLLEENQSLQQPDDSSVTRAHQKHYRIDPPFHEFFKNYDNNERKIYQNN